MAKLKTCSQCKTTKTVDSFYKDKSHSDGHHSHCKECHKAKGREYRNDPIRRDLLNERSRKWRLDNPEKAKKFQRNAYYKNMYGLTLDDYTEMFDNQNGLCAICNTGNSSWGKLAVDHCHISGKVRGLLCFNCNTSIGKMNDSPSLLRKAANYLEGRL